MKQCQEKYQFKLYALCIMSNHVHYLIDPVQDGMTQWHPAFLDLGRTLEECAAKYRKFCQRYKPKPKGEKKSTWGSRLLAGLIPKKGKHKKSPGQQSFWEDAKVEQREEVHRVAEKFIQANCFPARKKLR